MLFLPHVPTIHLVSVLCMMVIPIKMDIRHHYLCIILKTVRFDETVDLLLKIKSYGSKNMTDEFKECILHEYWVTSSDLAL